MRIEIADPGVGQQGAGILARSLVLGADADRLVALLEVIRGADDLPIEGLIEPPLGPADIGAKTSSLGLTSATATVPSSDAAFATML